MVLGDALKTARGRRSRPELARNLGVHKNTLAMYERGESLPDIDFLATFADQTGTDFDELVRLRLAASERPEARVIPERVAAENDLIRAICLGDTEATQRNEERFEKTLDLLRTATAQLQAAEREVGLEAPQMIRSALLMLLYRGAFEHRDVRAALRELTSQPIEGLDNFVMVPRYSVEVGAGHGRVPDEVVADRLAFRRDWISKELAVSPSHLAAVTARGDSMEPTVRDGDILLVDTSRTRLAEDGIYVIRRDDHLVAKRLQMGAGSSILLKSDNPAYAQISIEPEDTDELEIVGQVVWAGRKMR